MEVSAYGEGLGTPYARGAVADKELIKQYLETKPISKVVFAYSMLSEVRVRCP